MSIFRNQNLTEEELIKGCIKCNSNCQTMFYNQFSARMYSMCLRYVGDRETAQDVLQLGFIKVFNSMGNYRFQGSLEGWVKKIIINTTLQYMRENVELEN